MLTGARRRIASRSIQSPAPSRASCARAISSLGPGPRPVRADEDREQDRPSQEGRVFVDAGGRALGIDPGSVGPGRSELSKLRGRYVCSSQPLRPRSIGTRSTTPSAGLAPSGGQWDRFLGRGRSGGGQAFGDQGGPGQAEQDRGGEAQFLDERRRPARIKIDQGRWSGNQADRPDLDRGSTWSSTQPSGLNWPGLPWGSWGDVVIRWARPPSESGPGWLHPAEDHPTRAGLEDAGHGQPDHLAEVLLAVLGDDHRAVVEIAHPLPRLLASLEDLDHQGLAGQHDRLEGVGQVVEVDDLDPLEPGDLVQVVVVGDNPTAQVLGQDDELLVDLADAGQLGDLGVVDLDLDAGRLLELVEDVQPATPRFLRSLSELSAIPWSSWSTNRGTIKGWSMTRVSATSAIRPSMTTEVSRTNGRLPLISLENSM